MKNTFIYLAMFVIMVSSFNVSAKNLYVDAAIGDDTVSYQDNSPVTPWATLRRPVFGADTWELRNSNEAAKAGDSVFVAAGIYYVAAMNDRSVPAFMNVNSGNATDGYISYEAVGLVDLRSSSGVGPILGGYTTGGDIRTDYIKWKGFYINEETAPHTPDTGPIVIFGSNNVIIENCTIIGVTSSIQDNHNGIRFENAANSVARNNKITGIHTNRLDANGEVVGLSWHHNSAGIMLYGSHDILIENNDISDTGAGIFPKGNNNYNITIRKNYVHNVRKGIRISYSAISGQNVIAQNVIVNGMSEENVGIELAENTNNYIVANNTIDQFDNGININLDGQSNNHIQNNIITNSFTAVNAWRASAKQYTVNNNIYYITTQWANVGTIYSSLSSWQTGIADDSNSITSDPLFIDSSIGNYRLSDNSPAATLGVDLLDLDSDTVTTDPVSAGAYVTGAEVIGWSGDTIAPVAPVLLNIQ